MKPASKRKARAAAEPKSEGNPAMDEDSLPDPPHLLLTGSFAEQVTIIPRSMSSLIIATGFLDDEGERPVLLPFVEMMFAGTRQGDAPDGDVTARLEPVFSRTLPLENALWLSFDVVRDIRLSCARLRGMIEGNVAFDGARLAHARYYADQLRMEAEMCTALLDELSPAPAGQASEQTPKENDRSSDAAAGGGASSMQARKEA